MHRVAVVLVSLGLLSVSAMAQEYHLLKEIPAREGGAWAAMAVDETTHRLYAAHGNRVEVINLNSDTPAGAVTDISDIRGFALGPNFHMGYATSGKTQCASLVDLNTLRRGEKMKTGANPTAMVYEPGKLQLYAFNQGDHSATAAEADDGDFLATIDLGGKPTGAVAEAAAYDTTNPRVFASIEDKNEVVAIDGATHKISSRWAVAPGQSPQGLACDPANHLLFVACTNDLLLALDSTAGKVVASVPVGGGAGTVAFDPGTREIFCASSDGTVTIAQADTAGKMDVLQTIKTKAGATVLAADAKTHKVYLGAADFVNGAPVAGSLKISVYGK